MSKEWYRKRIDRMLDKLSSDYMRKVYYLLLGFMGGVKDVEEIDD